MPKIADIFSVLVKEQRKEQWITPLLRQCLAISTLLHLATIFFPSSLDVPPTAHSNNINPAISVRLQPTNSSPEGQQASNVTEIIVLDHSVPPSAPPQPGTQQISHSQENSDSSQSEPIPNPPPSTTYFSSKDVDLTAAPAEEIRLIFPEGASLGRKKASAILVLYIEETGVVSQVEIAKSELPPAFEKAAMETFKAAKMHPALKDKVPVKSIKKIFVEYEDAAAPLQRSHKKGIN